MAKHPISKNVWVKKKKFSFDDLYEALGPLELIKTLEAKATYPGCLAAFSQEQGCWYYGPQQATYYI